ncbi:MAG: YfgM family protein [Acidiferrobacterales bacterium]
MTDPYEDQEELEKVKRWWSTYGNALLLGIAVGLAALFGNKYWAQYKQQRAEAASAIYDQLLEEFNKKAFDEVEKSVAALMSDYSATPYAALGAMIIARVNVDKGKSEDARASLEWAVANATDEGTRHVARLRLARLLRQAKEFDGALAILQVEDIRGFESDYYELRGDLALAKGDKGAAREAYREALKFLDSASTYRPVLNMKLADLGPESS